MKKLSAIFEINLPNIVLVQWPEEQSIQFQFTHDNFDIELKLLPDDYGTKSKMDHEAYWTRCVDKISIKVGRTETEEIPDIPIDGKGHRDMSKRSPYFDKRLSEYRDIALCFYKRFITYFKYILKNPFIDESHYRKEDFANPKWVDESGIELGTSTITFFAEPIPGMRGDKNLGVKKFNPELNDDFKKALEKGLTPSLDQEILADAQNAIFDGNHRRGILEMAIACELVVKQAFFTKTTPAGSAFEYLEDKGKVRISALEFINRVSEDAFGKSFKTEHPSDYINIDHLFRCRNKIAHRGEVFFKDDAGILHTPNQEILFQWWESVETLLSWILKFA